MKSRRDCLPLRFEPLGTPSANGVLSSLPILPKLSSSAASLPLAAVPASPLAELAAS